MKKEIADLWVKALRSGEYQRTVGKLRRSDGFCCLGVLCDLHSQTSDGVEWMPGLYGTANYMGSRAALPATVEEWAGMASDNGRLSGSQTLANFNDGGHSFAQLADLIESNWEAL